MGQVFIMSIKDILFSKLLAIVNVPERVFIYEQDGAKKPPVRWGPL
jgi:hypothetical protein